MQYSFIDSSADIKTLQKQESTLNPFLLENNSPQISEIFDFFKSKEKLLLLNGFIGTGKTAICNYCLNFLNTDCIVLKYNCFEITILDDILLSFFEDFKKLAVIGKIVPPKAKSENFIQKINAYFETIRVPVVVVINSYEEVLKHNKQEILDFIKLLCSLDNVKVILISRVFQSNEIEIPNKKVTIHALEKSLFEKYLRSEDIKQIGPFSDELYKHTRGYFFYTNLSINIMKLKQLELIDFLNLFSKSLVTFNDFIIREALSLVDPVSGHLFRFLTIIRHPVKIKLLKKLQIYNEERVQFFTDNLLLSKTGDDLYLQDYYKVIAENSIPENVRTKIHQGCVDLYNTQLPLKPLERDLLISRQTMRNEIEYHSMYIPQQKFISKTQTVAPEKSQGLSSSDEASDNDAAQNTDNENKDEKIKKVSYMFDDNESGVLEKIADSINNYMSYSDRRREQEREDNQLSLTELMNKAKIEDTNFNYKYSINLYQKALLHKNDDDYYTYLPTIYTKMAFGYQNVSSWYDAQKYFEMALEFYNSTGDTEKVCEMKYYIANVLYMTFKKDKAKILLEEIEKQNISNELHIKILNLLANLISDPIVSQRYYKKALELSPQNVDKNVIAELYYKYAFTCAELGNEKEAIVYYKKCLEIKDNKYMSDVLSNIALLFDDIGQSAVAARYYKESLQIDEKNKNFNGMYSALMKLGEIYSAKDPQMAIGYYNKALAIAEELNETFYIVSSSIAIGDFYFYRKDDELAYANYQKAYKLVKDGNYEENAEKIRMRIEDIKMRNENERLK